MKIDLTQKVMGPDGAVLLQPTTKPDGSVVQLPTSLGKVLSAQLATATSGDALKFWGWAEKLAKDLPIEPDEADLQTLTEFVKNHTTMTVLVKAQLLKAFLAQWKA